jgi:hypothetical protein
VGPILDGKAKGAADALGMLRHKPNPDMAKKTWSAVFGAPGRG